MAQSGVTIGDNLFAMLQDLRPSVASTPDQRNSSVDYLRRVPDGGQSVDVDEVCGPTGNSSPKLRLKLHRLWGAKAAPRPMEESCGSPVVSADVEERHRRRAFAHYDCQSLTANLGYAAKLRGILLARRRNTATGASAASSFRASTPDETPEEDAGDGRGAAGKIHVSSISIPILYVLYTDYYFSQATTSSNPAPSFETRSGARESGRWG